MVESPRERRSIQTLVQNEAVFVQYLDVGLWHLAFYNDGKDKEMVSFNTVVLGRSGAPEGELCKGWDGDVGGSLGDAAALTLSTVCEARLCSLCAWL